MRQLHHSSADHARRESRLKPGSTANVGAHHCASWSFARHSESSLMQFESASSRAWSAENLCGKFWAVRGRTSPTVEACGHLRGLDNPGAFRDPPGAQFSRSVAP